MAAIAALRRMSQDLRDLRIPRLLKPDPPSPLRSRPSSFLSYRDPHGRFELSYPSEWSVSVDDFVHVTSASIGTFACVDPVPSIEIDWTEIERRFTRRGASMKLHRLVPGGVKGELRLGPRLFDWSAYAHPVKGGAVILSLGNVVDASRSAALEAYEDRILASIRRHFKPLRG